jgi:diguanylate cyclase (GGDEF)-like protein
VKILVADDDRVTLRLLDRILTEAGYDVLLAGDGAAAWSLCLSDSPSLVITDWEMPGLDGIALCSRIRQSEKEGYTYVIFLTGRSDRAHLIQALSAGADDFIAKPVHSEELRVRLRAAERILGLETHLRDANAQLVRMNERLLKMARLDPLMEIGNRLAFEEEFVAFHRQAEREGRRYAVVMCDMDHFKACNDNFGHQQGDDVLRAAGATIRRLLRANDAAFRYGGEEILIVLARQDLAGAVAAADRIRNNIDQLLFQAGETGRQFRVTMSCGVAAYPVTGCSDCDWRRLVDLADQALYEAKRLGRNAVVGAYCTPGGVEFAIAQEILSRKGSPAGAILPAEQSTNG